MIIIEPSRTDNYTKWCKRKQQTHYHCTDGCEHPQPLVVNVSNTDKHSGKEILICGRCYFCFDEIVEMVLCTDEIC